MGKLINIIPGSPLLISSLPARLQERMSSRLASLAIPQAFSKPCLVNFISKDTHLVFSIYYISDARKTSGENRQIQTPYSAHIHL